VAPPDFSPGAFHYTRRVQFAETDLAGIVHFSAYLRYMEEAEHALWRVAGVKITGKGLEWPRVSASCEYKVPLRFEDEIDVRVRAAFGSRRIQYEFVIARGTTIAATGSMVSVCARIETDGGLKSIVVPVEIVERLRGALAQRRPT
jgi:acyl-CoA thioester hydrolase